MACLSGILCFCCLDGAYSLDSVDMTYNQKQLCAISDMNALSGLYRYSPPCVSMNGMNTILYSLLFG